MSDPVGDFSQALCSGLPMGDPRRDSACLDELVDEQTNRALNVYFPDCFLTS